MGKESLPFGPAVLVCSHSADLPDTKSLDIVSGVEIERCFLGTEPEEVWPDFGVTGARLQPTPAGTWKHPHVAVGATLWKRRPLQKGHPGAELSCGS